MQARRLHHLIAIASIALSALTVWVLVRTPFSQVSPIAATLQLRSETDSKDSDIRPLTPSAAITKSRVETPAASAAVENSTELRIQVSRDDGRPAPFALISCLGPTVARTHCDAEGRLTISVESGSYEVLIPSEGFADLTAIYSPGGRSNAEFTIRTGESREIELIAYQGASLHLQFHDSTPDDSGLRELRVWYWEEEHWIKSDPAFVKEGGRCVIDGLEAGCYSIAPKPASANFFAPRVIQLEAGEQKLVNIEVTQVRAVEFDVIVRSSPGGPALPIDLSIRSELQGESSLPYEWNGKRQHDQARKAGNLRIQLFPGTYRLRFDTQGYLGHRTQLVPSASWYREVQVPNEGPPAPESLEFMFEEVGTLAIVRGKITGKPAENSRDLQLRHRNAQGRATGNYLWLQPDGSFEIVMDLTLIEGGVVSVVERFKGQADVTLDSLRLQAGVQEWTLSRPTN
ncbi:MAG: hypothetical protein ACI835_003624 [Planctomycetota bacterium]|jgi:hypothetical protein